MRKTFTISLLLSSLLLVSPCFAASVPASASPATYPAQAGRSGGFEATVVTVNLKRRVLTLRDAQGEIIELMAGNEARNLENLRFGDKLSARFAETIAVQLSKFHGEPRSDAQAIVGRAPEGRKPGGLFEREIRFLADVTGADAASQIVTVQGLGGRVVHITVTDPARFAEVKVGDQVEGVLVQRLELSVAPAAHGKAAARS